MTTEPTTAIAQARAVSSWEAGSGAAPPPEVTAVLGPTERLLWASTVKSTVSARPLLRIGSLVLIAVCFLALIAPWGQSVGTFCPPDEPRSCRKVYYSIFLCLFFGGFCAPWLLWTGWKAKHRPWLWYCVITTTRALLIDGRGPKLAKAVDLASHPPRIDPYGRLAFGREQVRHVVFDALTPQEMQRAVFWATEGRNAVTAKDDRP